tara:strand:- start:195 stop:431 length:237 start_codon:yes stop_codon:yes gene_type:complete
VPPSPYVKSPVAIKSTEANNLNIKRILNYMGQHISIADLDELERSLARNPGVVKNFFMLLCFIIVPQLVAYALMNVGR